MELKDVILSTLAEMEEEIPSQTDAQNDTSAPEAETAKEEKPVVAKQEQKEEQVGSSLESELMYLNSIRERLLVLFEGFQAPNNSNIEAKVDMTLNFLEYTLATIDARVEKLEKGNI